ncbi:MAG: DUF5018 domain-containing protein [Patescibacteria group bacterium]
MLKNKIYRFLFSLLAVFLFSQSGAWVFGISNAYAVNFQGDARIIDDTHLDFSPSQSVYPLNIITGNCASNVGNIGVTSTKFFKGDYPDDSRQFGSSVGTPTLYYNNVDLSTLINKGDDYYWAQFVISTMNNANCGYSAKGDIVYVTFEVLNGKLKTVNPPARANCVDGIQNQNETSIDTGGVCSIYSSLFSDTLEGISGSFNNVIQTLGKNLTGILTRIDVKTSNPSAIYYSSRPWLNLYECADDTYGSTVFSGSNCTIVYSGYSDDLSKLTASVQRFYTNPIVLNPSKYYFFTSAGNNAFNTTPSYHGSSQNTVDGACYQYRLGSTATVAPCATISDLYFNLYGITKYVPVLSSEKIITSFSFQDLIFAVNGVVDEANHTISLDVPLDTNTTSLAPMISISDKASVSPNNNVAQDFTNPVVYTVTAEDGSIQTYTVTVKKVCTIDCFSNVLFLPGLEASRLYTQKEVLGVSIEDQLWEPNLNIDIEDLYLNTDGTSKNSNIYTRDIIDKGQGIKNIYKSFSNMMDDLVVNKKIKAWEPYAYDWRQDVQDIVDNGTKYQNGNKLLIDTLQSLVDNSRNGKVTIVAHSNGGLIAKALLKKLQDDKYAGRNNLIDKVDVLILVAVPEIGTAKAVPAMLHGYDQEIFGGLLMDAMHARELGKNMLGAFGLLPSREYINRVDASPVTFVDSLIPSNITTKMVQIFGSALSSYEEYKSFLFGGEGRINPTISQINLPISLSQDLFNKAENLHNNIDAWIPPTSMRVIEVAGWGIDTVASFEYYPKLNNNLSYVLDERPRFTADGDKTVIVVSAQYMSVLGNAEKFWLNLLNTKIEHTTILENPNLLNFLTNIIKTIPDNSLSTIKPIDTLNRFRMSIHSPVTFDAYNVDGNHTGKSCPPDSEFCYVEENILNSSYLEFGEGKYINLPENQMSKVKLQGTDIGTFTYNSEKVLPDGTSTVSSFVDIPVTTQTQAEITLDQAGIPQLALDVTGDGVNDFTLSPNDNFDPVIYLQIMKNTIDSLDLSKAKIKAFDNRVDSIIKAIQKGKINKAKLKIEQFKKALTLHPKENDKDKKEREKKNEREHEKERKEHKKPKINQADAQLLLDMLNKLLDNIS